jgi:hypothetical protein
LSLIIISKRRRDVSSVKGKGKILEKLEKKCGSFAKIAKIHSVKRSMIKDMKNRNTQLRISQVFHEAEKL